MLRVSIQHSEDFDRSMEAEMISSKPAKILEISEQGLLVEARMPFEVDEMVVFNSPLFSDIGIDPGALKVTYIQSMEENLWRAQLSFIALSAGDLQILNHWLQTRRPH